MEMITRPRSEREFEATNNHVQCLKKKKMIEKENKK